MKAIAGIFVFLFLIVFVSCQKEIDWGLGGVTDKILYRIKSTTGTDTTQIDYTYDAGKRIIKEKTTGIAGGQNLDNELVINRNPAGIITTTVQKAAVLVAVGIDSVVTRYNYNTGTSKYTSSVFDLSIPGFAVSDSAIYTYDGSGRITGDSHYLSILGLPIPIPPVLVLKNTYTYSASGANLEMVAQDAATTPGGPLSPVSTQTYTFDAKKNPLIILNEAVLLSRTGLYNANNATKAVIADITDPTQNFTMDYTYKYNSANKPDSSTGTRTPGGNITVTNYFYQ
ncbi:MAG: hypothetical protein HZB42_00235 [Sphingobacteriales bacterium]|nr:hypothetical protein [Sphingobacteriales bacterium]